MRKNDVFFEVLASDDEVYLLVCTAHSEAEARELTNKWIAEFDPDCTDYLEFTMRWRRIGAIGTEDDCWSDEIVFDPSENAGTVLFDLLEETGKNAFPGIGK